LYTAADFELDERHVIKNEKVALDRLPVRHNLFLVSANNEWYQAHKPRRARPIAECCHLAKLTLYWALGTLKPQSTVRACVRVPAPVCRGFARQSRARRLARVAAKPPCDVSQQSRRSRVSACRGLRPALRAGTASKYYTVTLKYR